MNKTNLKITAVVLFALVLNAAFFGMLYFQELKRTTKRDQQMNDFLTQVSQADEARKRYYEQVASDRQKLREQMAQSKQTYDDLLAKQPGLVAAQKKTVTKMVDTVVPVTTKETVTVVSKPTSTKSTKAS